MKILILTPEIHFQSPIVMRELFEYFKGTEMEFSVILSPKLSSWKKSPSSLNMIIKNSGVSYLAFMILLKLKYDLCRFMEKMSSKNISQKQYMSPKEVADFYGIICRNYEKVNSLECLGYIRELMPDVVLSIFFNQILKKELLDIPEKGCLNLHPSFLPEYSGMSPVLWMLSDGVTEGGATVHYMNEKIDGGNILRQKKFPIDKRDSFFSVYTKAAKNGADLLIEVLSHPEFSPGTPQPVDGYKQYGPITRQAFKKLLQNYSFLRFCQ